MRSHLDAINRDRPRPPGESGPACRAGRGGPRSPTLAIDLWNLWLGPQPLSKELQQGLVEHLQGLGQSASPPAAPASAAPLPARTSP